jgi:hypothetical protein
MGVLKIQRTNGVPAGKMNGCLGKYRKSRHNGYAEGDH